MLHWEHLDKNAKMLFFKNMIWASQNSLTVQVFHSIMAAAEPLPGILGQG